MDKGADRATLEFYAREAPIYAASGPDGVSRHLPDFLKLLPAGAAILELGCGGGRDAAYMLAHGFAVEPTDGCMEIALQAERRLNRPVRVMRFDALNTLEVYDAVVASASLLHVSRAYLTDILQRIWRSLKPGGWHLATYKGGGTAGRDQFGRYFNYLSAEQAEGYYRAAGDWTDLKFEEGMGGGYDNKQGPWIKITARKGSQPSPTLSQGQ